MTNPKFRPADFTAEPQGFGRVHTLLWHAGEAFDPDRLGAAQLQHAASRQIRETAIVKYGTLKSYAEAAGVDYARLTQVLCGRQLMRLEDIATAMRLLGEDVHLASFLPDVSRIGDVGKSEPVLSTKSAQE